MIKYRCLNKRKITANLRAIINMNGKSIPGFKDLSIESIKDHAQLLQYFKLKINELVEDFEVSTIYEEALYQNLLKSICYLCPDDIMAPLFGKSGKRLQIESLLNKEMLKYPEFDFNLDPKYLSRSLSKTQDSSISHKLTFLTSSKSILSYLHYFDGNHLEAFKGFRWCLGFLYYVKKYRIDYQGVQFLLDDCKRICSILCALSVVKHVQTHNYVLTDNQCFSHKVTEFDILQGLLFTILECTKPAMMLSENILERYVLSSFFQIMGDIELCAATLNGSLIRYINSNSSYNLALKLRQCDVSSIIRKYIFAAALTIKNDPAIVYRSDRIVESILLYGDVCLDILRFFYTARTMSLSSAQTLGLSFPYNPSEYVTIAQSFIKEWESNIPQSELRKIQLPHIVLERMHGFPIIIEEICEQPLGRYQRQVSLFMTSLKSNIKKKPKLQESKTAFTLRQIGVEWVHLWEQLNSEYNGFIPSDLYDQASHIEN